MNTDKQYKEILEKILEIKQFYATQLVNKIMMDPTYTMPEQDRIELSFANNLENIIVQKFNITASADGLVHLVLDGKEFILNQVQTTPINNSIPSTPQIQSAQDTNQEISNIPTNADFVSTEIPLPESNLEPSPSPIESEIPTSNSGMDIENSVPIDITASELVSNEDLIESNEKEVEENPINISKPVMPLNIEENKSEPTIDYADKLNLFLDEKKKSKSEFVFDHYKLSASRYGVPGTTEIYVYIAPLRLSKKAEPNVPIVVHAYAHGNHMTVSSYDFMDTGKNIVTIEIDDFYLLCRGSFDAEGNFISYVLTTGPSANSGDIINVISKESGSKCSKGSGHIKYKDDNNIIEVFPLSLQKNEYLIIKQDGEFIDYFVSGGTYGLSKIVYFNHGIQKEIIAGWSGENGDYFEAESI